MKFRVLDVVLLALCLVCVASALEEEENEQYESEMRGIKAFKRKIGNLGRKSKPKKEKVEHELFTAPPTDGTPSVAEFEKLDQKFNDILKSIASLASNQREILDKVIAIGKSTATTPAVPVSNATAACPKTAPLDMALISSQLKNNSKEIVDEVRKVISNASLCAPPPATNTTRPKVIGNEGVVIGNQASIINGGDKAVPPGLNKCDVEMKRIELMISEVKVKADAIDKNVAAIAKRTRDLEYTAAAINKTTNGMREVDLTDLLYEVNEIRTTSENIYDSVAGLSNNISESTTEIGALHDRVRNISQLTTPAPNQVHVRRPDAPSSDANCAALSKDLTKSSAMHKELMEGFSFFTKMYEVYSNLTLATLGELKSDHQQMKIGLRNVTEKTIQANAVKPLSKPDTTGAVGTQVGTNINATYTLINDMHSCIMRTDMCLNAANAG